MEHHNKRGRSKNADFNLVDFHSINAEASSSRRTTNTSAHENRPPEQRENLSAVRVNPRLASKIAAARQQKLARQQAKVGKENVTPEDVSSQPFSMKWDTNMWMQPKDTYFEDSRPVNNLGHEYSVYLRPKQLKNPVAGSEKAIFLHMRSLPEIADIERIEHVPYFHSEINIHSKLPRKRNIELNPLFRGNNVNVKWGANSVALAVYLTGDEAEKPCERCKRRCGPFVGCVLPAKSTHGQVASVTCANCRYNWQSKQCDHHFSNRVPALDPKGSIEATDEGPADHDDNDEEEEESSFRPQPAPDRPALEKSKTMTGSCDPNRLLEEAHRSIDNNSTSEYRSIKLELHSRDDILPEYESERAYINNLEEQEGAMSPVPTKQESAEESGGAVQAVEAAYSAPDMMMDWEAAPGAFRTQSGDRLAYSASYLGNTNASIPLQDGIGARLETICPGRLSYFQARWGGIQICVVGGGTVVVTIGGENVRVSAGGMLKVPENFGFLVRNLSHVDISIHVIQLDT